MYLSFNFPSNLNLNLISNASPPFNETLFAKAPHVDGRDMLHELSGTASFVHPVEDLLLLGEEGFAVERNDGRAWLVGSIEGLGAP
jgi:hypothetical protein